MMNLWNICSLNLLTILPKNEGTYKAKGKTKGKKEKGKEGKREKGKSRENRRLSRYPLTMDFIFKSILLMKISSDWTLFAAE